MAKTNYNKMSNKQKEETANEVEAVVDTTVTETESVTEEVVAEVMEKPPVNKAKTGVVVGCERLNVRTNPSPTAAVDLTIARGTEVEIVGANGEFYNIRKGTPTEGFNGWCMKKYISIK